MYYDKEQQAIVARLRKINLFIVVVSIIGIISNTLIIMSVI